MTMNDRGNLAAGAAGTVTAAENVLKLLRYFEHGSEIKVRVACEELGLSRSTVQRLLRTLAGQGFVEHHTQTRTWGPGPALRAIGQVSRRSTDAGTLPVALEKLAKQTRETVHVAVLEGASVRYVAGVESERSVRTASRVGWTLPAHLTAAGKALLAELGDEVVLTTFPMEVVPGVSGGSSVVRADLLAELELVRARGYATSNGEAEPNVSAVAAALRDARDPRAAVVVTVPRSRGDVAWMRATGPLVVAFAAQTIRAGMSDRPTSQARPIDELVLEIFRVNARVLAAGDVAVKGAGLTSARWKVLGAVARTDAKLSVANIARTMGLTRQAVQRIANELVTAGLIEWEENPRHQRSPLAVLTDDGRATYDAAMRQWRANWASAIEEVFPEAEIAETTKRLRRLRGLLQSQLRVS
jgi:DNA-binding IclR family transcriptional regulator